MLRDAALGYASRGIPVLPLHYPLPHHRGLQPVTDDGQLAHPAVGTGCSCRDPGCGQVAKHPLGSLVPHGVKDATTNRARVLAWWTRHPQANIGLATGHRFDVLDVDGPAGAQAIRDLRRHPWPGRARGRWSGPAAAAGTTTWPPPAWATSSPRGLEHVDWRGRGGYVVAPPSRHASGHPYQWVAGRDLDTPLGRGARGAAGAAAASPAPSDPPGPVQLPAAGDGPGDRYARAALAQELARVATAPVGQRNRQLWESTRNLYNLVATGALDHREVDQGLLAGRRTLRPAGRGAPPDPPHPGLRPPGRPGPPRPPRPDRTSPERTHASPPPPARAVGERTKEGR